MALSEDESAYGGIANLYGRYAHRMDEGDSEGFAECFTEDCGFWPNRGPFQPDAGRFVGRDAVKGFLGVSHSGRPRHIFLNLTIEELDGNQAKCLARFGLFDTDEGLMTAYGGYSDEVVRGADGEWRFAEKEVRFIWQSDSYRLRSEGMPTS